MFDSGEVALKTAATSKDGSRRVNYSMIVVEVVTVIVTYILYVTHVDLNSPTGYWRASLVPAAAVIPAPEVYIYFVVVKTLVVSS